MFPTCFSGTTLDLEDIITIKFKIVTGKYKF